MIWQKPMWKFLKAILRWSNQLDLKKIAKQVIANQKWEKGLERPFEFDPNSTKNEGRFRLLPPDIIEQGTYFRRKSKTEGVSYVMGKNKKTGESVICG